MFINSIISNKLSNQNFQSINKKYGWNLSYSTFKSFYNFSKFFNVIDIKNFENKKILEIGSGLCQFQMIINSQLESYIYVCLDLPRMIPVAYNSFKIKLLQKENVEYFFTSTKIKELQKITKK